MYKPMLTQEPTKEQMQWFWEQCGFKYEKVGQRHKPDFVEYYAWIYPDDYVSDTVPHLKLPPIDLNNLFKYAAPKLISVVRQAKAIQLLLKWIRLVTLRDEDPANSLFELIYKALGDKDKVLHTEEELNNG